MQQAQIQKLTTLIRHSPVLRADEREAWLAMLPVMNDKQVSDLETILLSEPPATSPAQQTTASVQAFHEPPLRHIANLPSTLPINDTPVAAQSQHTSKVPMHASGSQQSSLPRHPSTVADMIKQRVQEKELPSGDEWVPLELTPGATVPKTAASSSIDPELQRMRSKIVEPRPNRAPNVRRIPLEQSEKPYIPLDTLLAQRQKQAHSAAENHQRDTVAASVPQPDAFTLHGLDDIQTLTATALEQPGYQQLSQQLVDLTRGHGYFDVLLRLEQSPLYKAYIEAGKQLLSGKGGGLALPKQKFEAVSDLLRKIQVSQAE